MPVPAWDRGQADVHAPGAMETIPNVNTGPPVTTPKIVIPDASKFPSDSAATPKKLKKKSRKKGLRMNVDTRSGVVSVSYADTERGELCTPESSLDATLIDERLCRAFELETHAKALAGEEKARTLAEATELRRVTPPKVWIQLCKVGRFKGHVAGEFQLTPKEFSEIVRNFKATANQRVPIDFEHASEAPETDGSIPYAGAPAQGWIVDLDNRGQSGLWGLVEWGDLARSYIRDGKYMYISPAIRFGARDRVTAEPIGAKLTSAGLTNQPFLDGMQALAAKDTPAVLEVDSATDDERITAAQALRLMADAMTPKPPAVPPPATPDVAPKGADGEKPMSEELTKALSAAQAERAELALKCKSAETEVLSLKSERDVLAKQLADRDERETQAEVEAAFLTYKDKKGYVDSDKADLLLFAKSNIAGFRRLHPAVKPEHIHLQRNLTGGSGDGPAAAASGAPAGMQKVPDQVKLTAKYMAKGDTLEVASVRAHKKICEIESENRAVMKGSR